MSDVMHLADVLDVLDITLMDGDDDHLISTHGDLAGLDVAEIIPYTARLVCEYCGVRNDADAPYCEKCGAPLGEQTCVTM